MSALRKYDDERYFAANDNLKNSTALKSLKKFLNDESGFFNLPAGLGLPFVPAAGGTTYITSIQQVSITIGSGATSNTATISSVNTSLAFIVRQGATTTSTAQNLATELCRVDLTNSTTVTATRNTSDTNSIVVNVVVIEGTSSLIDTIQQGTISVTSGNGSTTITSVDTTRSAAIYLGNTTNQTSASPTSAFCSIQLASATSVSAATAGVGTSTVGFVVVQFQAAVIKSIQKTSTTGAAGSATTTITSVTTANTWLAYGGFTSSVAAGNYQRGSYYVALASATQVTITNNTNIVSGSTIVKTTVVEFNSGVLNSLQRSTTTLTAATSNTSTITSVNTAKAFCNYLGFDTSATTNLQDMWSNVTLTNATTVTATKGTSTSNSTTSWEVVEFTA